jgi:hypothetical protein
MRQIVYEYRLGSREYFGGKVLTYNHEGTPRRRIIITSSLNKFSLEQLRNRVVVRGERGGGTHPQHILQQASRPQSNDFTRGTTEFSTFVCRGSSDRRKSAASHKFDMVWLYHSLISGGGGVFY